MQDRRKVDALLRSHYKLEPDSLDDETYWRYWYDYLFVRQQQRDLLVGVLRQVVSEAFPQTRS